jgi:putative FmdB family regulatory protein
MPDYGFYCHACMKTFSKVLTRAVYEEGEILCPHCSSDNVEQSWSVFYPITSKKSA